MTKIKCSRCGVELDEFVEYGDLHGHYRVVYNQKTDEYDYDGSIEMDDYRVNSYYCPECGARLDLKGVHQAIWG
jgi:hypothetical protein